MITHKLNKLPKKTYELVVTIPWTDVQEQYKKAFKTLHEHFEYKGFRKGKVPQEIAEKQIPKDAIYEQLIRDYLPEVYQDALKKEDLKPIMSPRVDMKKAKENEDWEIVFKLAEKPEVDLKNYKEAVKKAKADVKPSEIWVPGKEETKPSEGETREKMINEILSALLKEVKVEISDLIIEEELNNRLSKLVDDIQKLGLSTDTYLKSKNVTMEELKKRFQQEIEDTYKLEFLLMAIADAENITVGQEELASLFGGIKDEKDRQAAAQNAYFYATILRKQKTLEFLTSL